MHGPIGKSCLITGAGSGLGQATALALARLGNRLILVDRDPLGLAEIENKVIDLGATAFAATVDVTDPKEVGNTVNHAAEALGGLDCAVNCAAIEGPRAGMRDVDPAEWRTVVEVDLVGVFWSMRAEIEHMVEHGGSIVNIGSPASLRAVPGMSAYVAAKHALVGLTKSAALEFADRDVRVNLVCPGSFETPMSRRLHGDTVVKDIVARTPMRRPARLDEVVAPIAWLCSDAASFVTGAVISADGGRAAGDVAHAVISETAPTLM